MNDALQRHLAWFASLSTASLAQIDTVYHDDAAFSDPFQQVRGLAAIRAVYEKMFRSLADPRFSIGEVIADRERAFVTWDFSFAVLGRAQQIHGGSWLRLAADGRIVEHRDYWDAAEGVYEKLPGLGCLLRCVKRRLA
jgi:hypothetical protein